MKTAATKPNAGLEQLVSNLTVFANGVQLLLDITWIAHNTTLIAHNSDSIDTRYQVFSDPEMHSVPSVDSSDDQVLAWMTFSLGAHVVSVNLAELLENLEINVRRIVLVMC